MDVRMQDSDGVKVMAKNTATNSETGSAGDEADGIKITDAPQAKQPLTQAERDLAVHIHRRPVERHTRGVEELV